VSESDSDKRLGLLEPERIAFKAGQYIEGVIPGPQEWRACSRANQPYNNDELEFIIKLFPGGVASSYIKERMTIGEPVSLSGPYGGFHLRDNDRPALFVAGGSAMAPIPAPASLSLCARAFESRGRRSMGGATGLVTEVVAREVPDARGMEAYLCGPIAMIDAALPVLRRLGIKEADIHYALMPRIRAQAFAP
jgi:NAD(P)H-flavin reductase